MSTPEGQMDAIERCAAEWVLERDSGQFSSERRAALERWLSADSRHREAYLRYDEAWGLSGGLRAWRPTDGQIDSDVLARPAKEVEEPIRRAPLAWALAACVVAMLAGAVTWLLWPLGTAYSTAVGGYQRLVLDDGSVLQLNTNTGVRVLLNDHSRRVILERGEAFFDVARDRARPFVVQAGGRQIVAIGTQFAVRRERDDVRVTVTEGTVGIDSERHEANPTLQPDSSLLLPAGSVARIAATGTLKVEHHSVPDVESELTWRTGILAFHNQTLGDVVAEINRYNRRQFAVRDPGLALLPFGGNVRAADPQSLIDALRTLGIHAEETSEAVVLSRDRP